MRIRIIIIAFFANVPFFALAQNSAIQKSIRSINTAESLINRGDLSGSGNFISVHGLTPGPKELIGNSLLDNEWNTASILMYKNSELVTGYLVRFDISEFQFEVKVPNQERIYRMEGRAVQNVAWIDNATQKTRYFINGLDLKENGAPVTGFFEVLVDGEIPFLKRTKAILKRSNYNTALMVGNPNDEIVKRDFFYYLKGDQVIEVPNNKKKVLEIFADKQALVEAYAKQQNIYYKDNDDILKLFAYYNSLFEGYKELN